MNFLVLERSVQRVCNATYRLVLKWSACPSALRTASTRCLANGPDLDYAVVNAQMTASDVGDCI
jgi:hypothetical protein